MSFRLNGCVSSTNDVCYFIFKYFISLTQIKVHMSTEFYTYLKYFYAFLCSLTHWCPMATMVTV